MIKIRKRFIPIWCPSSCIRDANIVEYALRRVKAYIYKCLGEEEEPIPAKEWTGYVNVRIDEWMDKHKGEDNIDGYIIPYLHRLIDTDGDLETDAILRKDEFKQHITKLENYC